MKLYDVIIIGLGPAGCSAGIYATRYGLSTLIVGKEPGGQANEAYEIDNYPGMLGVKGIELMNKFREQAKDLGADIAFSEAVDAGKKKNSFLVKVESGEYEGRSLIIATGSKKRRLGIPGEKQLMGRGISYCSTCDAPLFRGKVVAVIGGGTSAMMAALMLTEHAKKVYLVYRGEKEKMRAMPAWIRKAEQNKKIEMLFSAVPKRIDGSEKVESMVFERNGKDLRLKIEGIFVEVGSEPQSELAKKLGVAVDKNDKIKVANDMTTNVKGIFAAGDVTNGSADFEQIITSAAEGANAARSAYAYLRKK